MKVAQQPQLEKTSEAKINYAYVTMQGICNTFIEVFFLWDVWFGGQLVYRNIRLPCLLLIRCIRF